MSVTPPPLPTTSPTRSRVRLWKICLAVFTFEVGLFLLVFPWRDLWYLNYFRQSLPLLESIWVDPFFRGTLSGIGLANMYLAVLEFMSAFRKTT